MVYGKRDGECKADGMRDGWSVKWMEVEIEGV